MEIGREQEYVGHDPRAGVGQAHGGIAQQIHHAQRHHRPGHHLKDPGEHRQPGEAQALDGEAQQIHKQQRDVEQGIAEQEFAAHGDDLRLLGIQEQQGQIPAPKAQNAENRHGVADSDDGAGLDPLMNPVQLPGPHILPREGGGGGADGVKGTDAEHTDLVAGGDRRHGRRAQVIDRRLEQDAADGGDGILQPHGYAHGQQQGHRFPAGLQILPPQPQNRVVPGDEHQAQDAGNGLGHHRGDARPGNPQLQPHDQRQIQGHVQQAGENQEQQRRPGIPQGADDAGQEIVEHGGGNTQENDENIIVGVAEGLRRGVHPVEDSAAQQGRNGGDDQREAGAQPDHGAHDPPQAVIIPLAEFLGHGDGKAGADAHAEAQHQKIDGAGGTNPRQGVHSQVLAHHHGIHHAVKLLEQQPEQQRQHEAQNQLHGGAGGQILCMLVSHNLTPRQFHRVFFVGLAQNSSTVFGECQ